MHHRSRFSSVFPYTTLFRSTLDAQARSTAAGRRGLDERQLGRLLRGDLDWAEMKALEKDRSRRYESAGAFAADVDRSEEHTSELQSSQISYAVFCLKKKSKN